VLVRRDPQAAADADHAAEGTAAAAEGGTDMNEDPIARLEMIVEDDTGQLSELDPSAFAASAPPTLRRLGARFVTPDGAREIWRTSELRDTRNALRYRELMADITAAAAELGCDIRGGLLFKSAES
jgi:hypothetical protein